MIDNGLSPADISAVMGNNNGGFGGGNGWWIILFILLCGIGGWGGYGNQGGGNVKDMYTLNSDFATIQRQLSDGFGAVEKGLDTVRNGLCDGFYTEAQLFHNSDMAMMQGFNATQAQIADCCCKTQSGIERSITQGERNTGIITNAIKDCCCDNEKQFMQSRFDAAQANCGTLQAIDKLGDRIIGYLANTKETEMRDYIRRLETKQDMDSLYGRLRPGPVPAFEVPAPWYMGSSCGCERRIS